MAQKLEILDSNRLLFGTNWIAVSSKPADYSALLKSMPVQSSVLEEIFKNEEPYISVDE